MQTTKAFNGREGLRMALLGEQDRLETARERLRAARIAQDTVHALVLAAAYVGAYDRAKQARGALDFADLILKTCELLTRRADAAWVLYKLDGGIDHILVDEAQGHRARAVGDPEGPDRGVLRRRRRGALSADQAGPHPVHRRRTRNSRSIPSRAPSPSGCASRPPPITRPSGTAAGEPKACP
ncbi:MAG: UvrD-helicase domain-containing protein [Caulobacteraceae bacterium]